MAIGDKAWLENEKRKLINQRTVAIVAGKRLKVYRLNNQIAKIEQQIKDMRGN